MRIRVKPSHRRIDRVSINLASMIDVTFLLLFFFMVATVLGEQESRLSTALQTESGSGAAADFQPQNLEVRLVGGSPVYKIGASTCSTRQELEDAFEPLPKEAGLFIKVYDDVPVGFAVSAVQTARDVGFDKVTYVPGK